LIGGERTLVVGGQEKLPMLTIVHSIATLVLIIVAGVVAGRTGFLPPTFPKGLSDFCFYFGMPALLIRTIATTPPGTTAAHLIWGAYLLPAGLV
jgi:predicted permease